MYQAITLQLPAGTAKIMTPIEFFKGIQREITNQEVVEIAKLNSAIGMGDDMHADSRLDAIYDRQVVKLKPHFKHEISHQALLRDYGSHFNFGGTDIENNLLLMRIKEYVYPDAVAKLIDKEFKPLVAKKSPGFLAKDLTIEKIADLSYEYAQNFGCSDICAFEYNLSPYQKFFILGSYSAFKVYTTEIYLNQCHMKRMFEFQTHGAFVELNPNHWVVGRYEERTYLKEMASQERFMPGMGVTNETVNED